MDDWSWQERYSQSAFLPVPCLFPAFELRLLSGNCITAAPTNARLKTEGLFSAAHVSYVLFVHHHSVYPEWCLKFKLNLGKYIHQRA